MTPRKPQIVYLETQPDGRVFEGVPKKRNDLDCTGCACISSNGYFCDNQEFRCYSGTNPTRRAIIYKPTGFREPKR